MIEYLEQLVEDKKYKEAIIYSETLMMNEAISVPDLLAVSCGLLIARVETGEYYGGLVTGQMAMKLASDLLAWDHFGRACLYTGVALGRLNQHEQAVLVLYEFLAHVDDYDRSRIHEPMVWFNLGIANIRLQNYASALDVFQRALCAAKRLGNQRHIHGVRHGLISSHVKMDDLSCVPRLLAECAHYLRHNGNAPEAQESSLWHQQLRIEFAIRTGRLVRATILARRALRSATGLALYQFHFHMALALISQRSGDMKGALGNALSARVYAIRSRRFDLESEASELTYQITTLDPSALQRVPDLDFQGFVDSLLPYTIHPH